MYSIHSSVYELRNHRVKWHLVYTGWVKKVCLFIVVTFCLLSTNFHHFCTYILGLQEFRKFATEGYIIVSPPNMVCVTTLPYESWLSVDKVIDNNEQLTFLGPPWLRKQKWVTKTFRQIVLFVLYANRGWALWKLYTVYIQNYLHVSSQSINILTPISAFAVLSPVHTGDYSRRFWRLDCRQIWQLLPNSATVAVFDEFVAVSGDNGDNSANSRKCGQGFSRSWCMNSVFGVRGAAPAKSNFGAY